MKRRKVRDRRRKQAEWFVVENEYLAVLK